MFLDPEKLDQHSPAEILEAASQGHIGLDHQFLRALLDRPAESVAAALALAERDRTEDVVDIASELIALFHHWRTVEAVPFLVRYVEEDPSEVPEDAIEALVHMGDAAIAPLIDLYERLDEDQSGEVSFILASMGIHDPRILGILESRLEYDLPDTVFQLGVYGDPAALPLLDRVAAALDKDEEAITKEIADAREAIQQTAASREKLDAEAEKFDIWALYPERQDIPVDLLDDDQRLELLDHPIEAVRAASASSFFNRELSRGQRLRLLKTAQQDDSPKVRARAWEALTTSTEDVDILEAMLSALRSNEMSTEERGGLLVGLSAEADRNEVRVAIGDLYKVPAGLAKALEAMWRSMHPTFHDHFAKHIDDSDVEVRRSAVWGVGYYGVKSQLDKVRKLFDDEELRSDALFAYALAVPGEVSRGRMRGLLTRIEKDARGLSEMEEGLVKAALDERLMLAGKEPFFAQQED